MRADRVPAVAAPEVPPPPVAGAQSGPARFSDLPPFGYGESFEWTFVEGAFERLGPATLWVRPNVSLVEGEELSPLARVLSIVDSANGVSAELPPAQYVFVPVELTVSLQRLPRTASIALRARTSIEDDGIGITRAELFDEGGFLGVASQTLFAAPR